MLYANVNEFSKYSHQASHAPFKVVFVPSKDGYHFRGNDNCYAYIDLDFYFKDSNGELQPCESFEHEAFRNGIFRYISMFEQAIDDDADLLLTHSNEQVLEKLYAVKACLFK